jgi:ankyrin repeat protein
LHGGKYGDALQAAVVGSSMGHVEDNNIDVVRLVIDHGADLNYHGGLYHSAMRATVFCGNIAAAHFLRDHNVEVDDDIFLEAIQNERTSVVPRLLEMGMDVNAENRRGTALQFAIKNGDAATIRFVLVFF